MSHHWLFFSQFLQHSATKEIQSVSIIQSKAEQPTDSVLISRYLNQGDQSSFSILYRRYARKVYAKCIAMLRDDNLAHDATQDIFIKVILNLAKFSEQSSFSTWLYSISYNYCIDIIRKKKKLSVVFLEDMTAIGKEHRDDELPDSVLLDLKLDHLDKVLTDLPPGDRAILLMKYQDGLQIRDIAETLNKSESAIKMQIMRAKNKAQSILDNMEQPRPGY